MPYYAVQNVAVLITMQPMDSTHEHLQWRHVQHTLHGTRLTTRTTTAHVIMQQHQLFSAPAWVPQRSRPPAPARR
jgi:hypothetical protein